MPDFNTSDTGLGRSFSDWCDKHIIGGSPESATAIDFKNLVQPIEDEFFNNRYGYDASTYLKSIILLRSGQLDNIRYLKKVMGDRHPFLGYKTQIVLISRDVGDLAWCWWNVPDFEEVLEDIFIFAGEKWAVEFYKYFIAHPREIHSLEIENFKDTEGVLLRDVINQLKIHSENKQPSEKPISSNFRIATLIPTHSTVIGNCMRKITDALKKHDGVEVIEITEQNRYERLTGDVIRMDLMDIRPDAYISIHKPVQYSLPDIKSLCWVQDPDTSDLSTFDKRTIICPVTDSLNWIYKGQGFESFSPLVMAVDPSEYEYREQKDSESDICFISHLSSPPTGIIDPALEVAFKREALLDYAVGERPISFNPTYSAEMMQRICKRMDTEYKPDYAFIYMTVLEREVFRLFWMMRIIKICKKNGLSLALYGRDWDGVPEFEEFARGPIYDKEILAETYRSSKIQLSINPHINLHQRFLESTLSGSFVLMPEIYHDKTATGISKFFTKDEQYVTFNDDDFEEKILFYVDNGEARQKIVKAAIPEILKNHTYEKRAEEMLKLVRS